LQTSTDQTGPLPPDSVPLLVIFVECSARLLDRSTDHLAKLDVLVERLLKQPGLVNVCDLARVNLGRGIASYHQERFSSAVEELQKACTFADACRDPEIQAITRFYLARAHHRCGQLQAGADAAEHGAAFQPGSRVAALCQVAHAWINLMHGKTDEAEVLVKKADDILVGARTGERHGDYIDECNILALWARLLRYRGPAHYAAAADKLREAIQVCASNPEYVGLARCRVHLGFLLLLQAKRYDRGTRRFEELKKDAAAEFTAAERCCTGRPGRGRVLDRVYYYRARWYLELGDSCEPALEESLHHAKRAQVLAERIEDSDIAAQSLITQSIIERKRHHPGASTQLADAALGIGHGGRGSASKLNTENRRIQARARICFAMALLQHGVTYNVVRADAYRKDAGNLLRNSDNDYFARGIR
jgi:tetratricopeptide (TPR) repeat protein